jgi:protein-L-isoaspartate(D-aspartate) O-methyltransferase
MSLVPREAFVPMERRADAYADGALAIGGGQTISQPYMVARMTELLGLADQGWPWADERRAVLDVGTGSGYQAAVLAQLGAVVISVERDAALAESARERLDELGYAIEVVTGDGAARVGRRRALRGHRGGGRRSGCAGAPGRAARGRRASSCPWDRARRSA